ADGAGAADTGVRWGRLSTTRPGTRVESVGFPAVLEAPDRFRDLEQLSGTVNPLTRGLAGLHDVAGDSPPAPGGGSDSPWGGMSGAAVFCGPLLLGVVGWDTAGFDSRRVTVTPVSALAADAEFCRLVERACGRRWVAESVELYRLFARPARVGSPAS